MEPYKIVKDTNPTLRNKCKDVEFPLSHEDRELTLNMLKYIKLSQDEEYLKQYPSVRSGIGIAAPQIGISKKIIAIYFKNEDKIVEHALINPTIISYGAKKCYLSRFEGCLSVEKQHEGYVMRSYKIRVKAYDAVINRETEFVAYGLEAIVLQHEIDHLSGILYYDRINPMNPFYIAAEAVEI